MSGNARQRVPTRWDAAVGGGIAGRPHTMVHGIDGPVQSPARGFPAHPKCAQPEFLATGYFAVSVKRILPLATQVRHDHAVALDA